MEGDRGGPRWTDMDGGRERMISPNWNALGGAEGGEGRRGLCPLPST